MMFQRSIVKNLSRGKLPINFCACLCHRYIIPCSENGRHFSDQSAVRLSHQLYEPKHERAASHIPVLILHGVYGSKKNWDSLAKRMANQLHRTIVTIDARNHGQSDHSPAMSYDAMASDVQSLIEFELDTDQCDLIGHSMGGRTGMALALSQPAAVRKLVVVDVTHNPPPRLASDTTMTAADYAKLMRDVHLDHSLPVHRAKKDVGRQLEVYIPDGVVRSFLLTNLIQENGLLRWRLNLEALESNMGSLRQLHIPAGACFTGDTLFIRGSNSKYLRPSDYPELRRIFPSAAFTTIEGAGHWVHFEKPNEFLHAVLPFLQEDSS